MATFGRMPAVMVNNRPVPLCQVVKIQRSQGQIVQDCNIYIGRQCYMGGWRLAKSKWHNPFKLSTNIPIDQVCQLYYQHVLATPELINDIEELRGKVLGCWCVKQPRSIVERLNQPICHGEVLMKIIYQKTIVNLPNPILLTEILN